MRFRHWLHVLQIAFISIVAVLSSGTAAKASCSEAMVYLNASAAALKAAEATPTAPAASFEKRLTLFSNADAAKHKERIESLDCSSIDETSYAIFVTAWILTLAADSSRAIEPYVTNQQCRTYSALVAKSSIATAYHVTLSDNTGPPWSPTNPMEMSVQSHVPKYIQTVAKRYGMVLPDPTNTDMFAFRDRYEQAAETYKATMTMPCRAAMKPGIPKAIVLIFFGE